MYTKTIKLFFLFIGILIFFSCCEKTATNLSTGKLTIVTSFYPIYISTINITKDIADVEVVNLTKPQTGCLHDYQLTPADLVTLENADIFVMNGLGMESFIETIETIKKMKVITAGNRNIDVIEENNGINPHVWVSISNHITEVKNITEKLVEYDAKNAVKYKANSDNYIKKLEVLKQKMHISLKDIKNRNIITFHEAFPYFAKEFNFNIAAVIEREPGTAPTTKELKDTIKTVRDLKIKALFAEPQYPAKAADTIAAETGAKVYTLDPFVTGEANNDYDAYIKVMNNNLNTLLEALK